MLADNAQSRAALGTSESKRRICLLPASREDGQRTAEVCVGADVLQVRYEIRRLRRARFIRLTLKDGGLARLSVPWHCSSAEALAFLRSQGEWLKKQMAAAPRRVTLSAYLRNHPLLYARGHGLHVKVGQTRGRSYYLYSMRPPEVMFQLNGEEAGREVELIAQVRLFAEEVLPVRVQTLAQAHGFSVKRVSVRNQSSRWGSCSSSGTLSLNWRLVLLRPSLQDHVILHELAHLKEMNHSERFWNLLRKLDPHCDSHDAQLNAAAAKVMPLVRG